MSNMFVWSSESSLAVHYAAGSGLAFALTMCHKTSGSAGREWGGGGDLTNLSFETFKVERVF